MNWLKALLRRGSALDGAVAARLAGWRGLERPGPGRPLGAQRMVVVDVEASGLDPYRDRLISVGAVAVEDGLVLPAQCFEAVLRQDSASLHDNIVVHRIGGSAQRGGRDPAEALVDFLAFAGKDPLIAFHSDFDRVLIERAARAALGVKPENAWLDLAVLAPALLGPRARSLDDWLELFGIENDRRHDALADAVATAQLLLPVLAAAHAQGLDSCARLLRMQKDYLWLEGGRNALWKPGI